MLVVAGSAAGGLVWGWLVGHAGRPGSQVLVLSAAAVPFLAVAGWLGGGATFALVSGAAVGAGLVAHAALWAALERRARR